METQNKQTKNMSLGEKAGERGQERGSEEALKEEGEKTVKA
jgi:hypothetical protein